MPYEDTAKGFGQGGFLLGQYFGPHQYIGTSPGPDNHI